MNNGISSAEFSVRFPDPAPAAMRIQQMVGMQVYHLLWAAGGALPEDCRELRGLMATILGQVYRGNDTELLRTLGRQLLSLAWPAIDDQHAQIRDQVERFLAETRATPDDEIP